MKSISFLIKPASGRCNLACRYCFYRDVADNRDVADFGLMSGRTMDALLDRAFELDADTLSFGFQGGEPTLAGLPFFEAFVAGAKERAGKAAAAGHKAELQFAIQTNGLAIDAAWASFLKREHFLVGLSIDGPRILHDAMRVRRDGSGSHGDAMRAASLLREAGVPVNALCVVDAATADNPELVYRHLRSRGFDWIQFIPCLDPLGEEPGGRAWSLEPEAYGNFLRATFDLRYQEWSEGIPVSVRWIDNLVGMAMGRHPELCGMSGSCSVNFTVEADGSVYPCDFYVTDEWRLGSVLESPLDVMRTSPAAERFVSISRAVDPGCRDCFAYALCRGGCRRDREPFAGDAASTNRYCKAYKEFFAYAGERIMRMAKAEAEVRAEAQSGAR
jgi:radical SAM additional 4Fe4S-binding domain